MKLADSLKKVRKKSGLSQKEFADKLGINARTYASYERGERDISTAVLLNICKTLNVSSDELLGNDIQPSSSLKIGDSNSESLISDLPKKVVSKKFKVFAPDNLTVKEYDPAKSPYYVKKIFIDDQSNSKTSAEQLCEEIKRLNGDAVTVEVIPYSAFEIKDLLDKLNDNGKNEAVKRVRELTLVPEYKKTQEEEQEISELVQISDKKQ